VGDSGRAEVACITIDIDSNFARELIRKIRQTSLGETRGLFPAANIHRESCLI
jgi:hypothetical protein